MSTQAEVYAEVKDELASLARPLIVQSEKLLRERGDFLPHAAVLNEEAKVSALGAMCSSADGFANSWHILPLLYEGLRSMASERGLIALGVAERVDAIPGHGRTLAIKVLLEHQRGISLVMYMPFTREPEGDFTFGKTITMYADAEVNAWRAWGRM